MNFGSLLFSFLLLPAIGSAQLLPVDSAWVERTLAHMTLDEKIGQLIMPPHFDLEQSKQLIQDYHVGGFFVAKSEAKQIASELNDLQRTSRYPLLISADFEKGAGTHIDRATDLPMNMALAASRNPEIAYRAAKLTAVEARAMGIHLDFAPVLDVNNNPQNPIINVRSFGEDPKLVAEMGASAIRGYQENGLLATAKHFPGHGNTSTDSHSKLGTIEASGSQFESVELFPYREVFLRAEPAAIMTAHLWAKAVDTDTIPATISKNAITSLLRDRMKFNGLIVTDAMIMGGITNLLAPGDATVRAIQAGCDLILWPGNPATSFEAIQQALEDGRITVARIDASVRRILNAKTRVGLDRERFVNEESIQGRVGTETNYQEAKAIASRCITLVKDEAKLLPLKAGTRTVVITMGKQTRNAMMSRSLISFPGEMRNRDSSVITLSLPENPDPGQVTRAHELARKSEVVVVAAYVQIVIGSGTVELSEAHQAFVKRLIEENPRTILVSFGNPYIGVSFPALSTYICAYDNARALQAVAVDALYGRIPFTGKLPVTLK